MFDYQHAIFYEVWPRSFQDSNQDGIGDIQGIIRRIPYLKWLGIDALWLAPIYKSPNDDYGYDIEDYYSINKEFGTMDDFKELIKVTKENNIALIMDLVVNHTSTAHAWFKEAIKDPNSKYRDYYIFKKGTKDTPPNNWLSFFGTSAWQKAEDDMWYLTLYSNTQADLNWKNKEVREEIKNIMRFYLDLGIDGFRMDTINTIDKKEGLPNVKPTKTLFKRKYEFPGEYVIDGPLVKDYLQELRRDVLDPYDAFALGEGVLTSVESCIEYAGGKDAPLNAMFHFDLVSLGYGELGKYDPRKLYKITSKDVKNVIHKWQHAQRTYNFVIGNYISNHDHKRPLERFGDVKDYRLESSKMLALLNFVIPGIPFIYQGEEIGMKNPTLKKKDWRDYEAKHASIAMSEILKIPPIIAEKITSNISRDNARTPMQWTSHLNGDFSTATPWIKMVGDEKECNVRDEMNDRNSTLRFYHKLIELYHKAPCLSEGTFIEYNENDPSIYQITLTTSKDEALIFINLTDIPQNVSVLPTLINDFFSNKSLLTNYKPILLQEDITLAPYEVHLFYRKKRS